MANDFDTVCRIAWRQVLPWILLFRTLRPAISLPFLTLATCGVLVMPIGWHLAESLLRNAPPLPRELQLSREWHQAWFQESPEAWGRSWAVRPGFMESIVLVYWHLTEPFYRLASRGLHWQHGAYFLAGGLWNLGLWAFLGGTMTRLAAVWLGRDERVGLGESAGKALRDYGWYAGAPLFPLLGVCLLAIPSMLIGVLLRFPIANWGAVVLWPLAWVTGLCMAILLVGLSFGWPLMFPTISSEKSSDAFEAFSRSFSYTFQRPLHYAFYASVAMVLGLMAERFVKGFAWLVVQSIQWSVEVGAGGFPPPNTVSEQATWTVVRALQLFPPCVATAFPFSFFFCSATAIYLLLRRDVDHVQLDEVHVDDPDQRYGLGGD